MHEIFVPLSKQRRWIIYLVICQLLRYAYVLCMYILAMNGMVIVSSLRVELSLPKYINHHGATVTSQILRLNTGCKVKNISLRSDACLHCGS